MEDRESQLKEVSKMNQIMTDYQRELAIEHLGLIDQVIRNQQVACSSHVSSSTNRRKLDDFRRFRHFLREYSVDQNVGQTLTNTVTHTPK